MARPKPTMQTIDRNAFFQKPRAASIITGLSLKSIYAGCRDGSIPASKQGSDWVINMHLWLQAINAKNFN